MSLKTGAIILSLLLSITGYAILYWHFGLLITTGVLCIHWSIHITQKVEWMTFKENQEELSRSIVHLINKKNDES